MNGSEIPKTTQRRDVLAVTAAVMVESRYGDPRSIPFMSRAEDYSEQEGRNQLPGWKPWHSCVIQGLHLAGSGLGMVKSVYDIKEMRQHADVLIETLRNIQEFDLKRRRQRPQPKQKPAVQRLLRFQWSRFQTLLELSI